MSRRSLAAMNAPSCPANAKKCIYGAWEPARQPGSMDELSSVLAGCRCGCGYGCGLGVVPVQTHFDKHSFPSTLPPIFSSVFSKGNTKNIT